ncbi:hypothetical protein KBC55_00235 [Patescibacteria group bacterium]|nr:hypothetical protein [Patescibacteria group bacterium]
MTQFSGIVIAGHGEAAKYYSLPTANIAGIPNALPAGSYLANATAGGFSYPALVAIDARRNLTEVHLFGFAGDLLGQTLELSIGDQIAIWEPFTTIEAMRAKIALITKLARKLHNLS